MIFIPDLLLRNYNLNKSSHFVFIIDAVIAILTIIHYTLILF